MSKVDLRKERKELYRASAKNCEVVEVPEFSFLMIDGKGFPDTPEYEQAVQALYSLSYTIKFMMKEAGFDYTVMPLEGIWWSAVGVFDPEKHEDWRWTMMVRQPKPVTQTIFDKARGALIAEKKDLPALPLARLEKYEEGPAVQILHVGPYETEDATITQLHQFAADNGFEMVGKHHEIYISDPRRSAPEKLKTIIRQPIKSAATARTG